VKQSVQGLRDDLSHFQTLLSEGALLSFSVEERESLIAESHKHLRKLEDIAEGFLTIGLLGGTGVGKSSIMNALAGLEIASTSYRRPHTDQVLIYHHAASFMPASLQKTSVPWREITHQADAIQQILLCDLPDFDSLLDLHREHVIGFLEHLDVLVWVTSPEKYADERFYTFLREVPKAKQNFYFVLNKADLLFEGQSMEIGYDQLAKVTANFRQYLTGNGVTHPLIYALSAGQIVESRPAAPWNQFASFRQQIFQHRDIKEIMAIKAANLDVEVQQLLSMLDKEAFNLASVRQILDQFVEDLEKERAEWNATGEQAFELWLKSRLKKDVSFWVGDVSALVGPGHVLATLFRDWKEWIKRETGKETGSKLLLEGMSGSSLRRQLERIDDRMAHRVLSRGLPAVFKKQLGTVLDVPSHWEDLRNRLHYFVEMWPANANVPSFVGFRTVQYLAYVSLSLFLIMAVGGHAAWRTFLASPGWSGLAGLLAAIVSNLFSPAGLAALGSYMLLSLFFALRFYGRHKKLLRRHTQKFIESLRLELGRVWEGELDSIINHLRDYDRELDAQMSAIEALRKTRKRD